MTTTSTPLAPRLPRTADGGRRTTDDARWPARRRPGRALACALAAGAVVAGASACSSEPDPGAAAQTDVGTTTARAEGQGASTSPAAGGLLDGTRRVDIQAFDARWVTTTVEGGLTTVADPSEAGVATTWVIEPLEAEVFVVRTTALTDGASSCLSLAADTVTVASCDPTAADQQVQVSTLDRPDQVSFSSPAGSLTVGQDGLAVSGDPSSPATVFTLVDRGAAAS